jgi:predicted permease
MPDWKIIVCARLKPLRLSATAESDLAEELAQHLDDRYSELIGDGASEADAERQVISELDDMNPLRLELKRNQKMPRYDSVPPGDIRPGNLMEDLWRDLRYTSRTMRKNKLFVLFVVLTLALGIGANTTVFTIINTLILNPLPVQDSSSLEAVTIAEAKTTSKSTVSLPVSRMDLEDYQARNEVFGSLAAYTGPRIVTLQINGGSQRMFSEFVTGNYFSTLGLNPSLGRFFLRDEDTTPGAHPLAVINYATWQARFGGTPNIIGRSLRLNNVVVTVIGVAPPHFIGVNAVFGPDLWIPAAMAELLLPNEMQGVLTDRGKGAFLGIGRLKPGISRSQAQANLATIASTLALEYPEADQGHTAVVRPVREVIFGSANGGSAPILFGSAVLLIVVGIILLIACSNVANLLLARSAARQQEVAVRLAIGASRRRLVRQLLTESVFLGLISGVIGFLIGYAGLQFLWSFLPPEVSANLIKPKMDIIVFIFTTAISLLTGFVFGAVPALRASRTSMVEALKEEARTVGKSRRRMTLSNALLVAQVAFSFLSLITAALFLRSIERAYDLNPGFQTRNLAVFLTNPGQAGYGKPQAREFYKEVRNRVASMPGIESVSWASNLPLWGRTMPGLRVEGRAQRSKTDTITSFVNTVDLNYFETAGTPIDEGREFTRMDTESSTPVAIVNEKMVHDYWPNGNALGKRIQLPTEKFVRQIVGIARTANYSTLAEAPQPCVYVPLEQSYYDAMTLYVHSKGDPQQVLSPVQREIRTLGPQILVDDVRTGSRIMDAGLFQAKMGVGLLIVFGLLALGLASIGLYGIMAYSVNQRKREIGVRMALGAARESVLRLILKQGMSLVITGVIIGWAASLLVARLLAGMLYGIRASDPISIAGAAVVLLSVALIACYLPARWASRLDPLVALRDG